jgi:thiol-disulfide isomerase/thioredoxin
MNFCYHISRRLVAYGEGEVSSNERARIEAHLDGCARCRERCKQIRQRTVLMRQLPILDPAEELWDAIARDASASKWPEPVKIAFIGETFSGRRWSVGQSWLLRWAVITSAIFIIATALLLIHRSGLSPDGHKGELNLAGYLDLVGTVAAAEPALREFPAAPGFIEVGWPEARATVAFPAIAPETLPGGYKLTAVRLYNLGNLRALQFKYHGEQGALCVFQLPSGSKLSFGERLSEQYQADGVHCLRARSRNCVLYRFVLGETQCALMTRQTDPTVVDALIQAFNAEARSSQTSSALSQSEKKEQSPQMAAGFKLPDLDGRQISSADYKGNVVVLDFWATWCGPCLAEMPAFNSLHTKYAGRGVKVIGIAVQSGWAQDIKPYRDQYKIAYPILVGDDEVVEKYGVIGFPTTYILDKGLNIHRKFTGKLPGKEELEREIESLLADR